MNTAMIVGVDGSTESLDCLRWAAEEAHLKGLPLRVVHVAETPGRMESERRAAIVDARKVLALRFPELDSGLEFYDRDDPGPALVALGGLSALLVLGSRGLGGSGSGMGSVARYAVSHARCPVVVVRARYLTRHAPELPRDVTVGIDPSEGSFDSAAAALEFAFEEASRRRTPLRVLHASTRPSEAELLVSEALAAWRESFPDVKVVIDVAQLPPRRALVAASEDTELLVLGSTSPRRGIGIPDSVTLDVIRHTLCPVAVIPKKRA